MPLKVESSQLRFAFKPILCDIDPFIKLSSALAAVLDTALVNGLRAITSIAMKNALQAKTKTLLIKHAEKALYELLQDWPETFNEMHARGSMAIMAIGLKGSLARKSRSSQAGVKLSVSRIEKLIRARVGPSLRVSDEVSVYLAGALEKSLRMLFEKALLETRLDRRKVVTAKNVQKAVVDNPHFGRLYSLCIH
jgi:histone H3/H4